MRHESFSPESLARLLRRQKIATMAEMKAVLGSRVDMTVFRKLRTLDYLTSYSHGGRFYTLRDVANFDSRGLWSHGDVHFSDFGSLVDTSERFVLQADGGYFAAELAEDLLVEVKDPLLKLVRAARIAREDLFGCFLYCARDPARRRQQILIRRSAVPDEPFSEIPSPGAGASDETRAAIILFLSSLNEKQRRLFAGLESLRMGRGGDQRIAEWTGLDAHTVAKGRHELQERDVHLERIRRPGGGRPSVEKKRPKSSKPSSF